MLCFLIPRSSKSSSSIKIIKIRIKTSKSWPLIQSVFSFKTWQESTCGCPSNDRRFCNSPEHTQSRRWIYKTGDLPSEPEGYSCTQTMIIENSLRTQSEEGEQDLADVWSMVEYVKWYFDSSCPGKCELALGNGAKHGPRRRHDRMIKQTHEPGTMFHTFRAQGRKIAFNRDALACARALQARATRRVALNEWKEDRAVRLQIIWCMPYMYNLSNESAVALRTICYIYMPRQKPWIIKTSFHIQASEMSCSPEVIWYWKLNRAQVPNWLQWNLIRLLVAT